MIIHNTEVAAQLNQVADLLEIEGANAFRVRAYRNAARIINGLSQNLGDMLKQQIDLTTLPGIGEDLADKIKTIVTTGEFPLLKEIEARTSPILSKLMQLEGLGPKRVQLLYKKLGIRSLDDLKQAIKTGKLRKLRGFGEKTAAHILSGIEHEQVYVKRFKLSEAEPIVDKLLIYLKKHKAVKQVECAGSYRRHKETVGDLDFLITTTHSAEVMKHFLAYPDITQILSRGETRATVHLHSGIQVDLRVVPPENYGAALLYLTGSKEHSIILRKIALQQNLKVNEYGIYQGKKLLASRTEKEMYRTLGLDYIEPELREDRGEIVAAQNHRLPKLMSLEDLRGDLHSHTNATDGTATLEEMAKAAEALGYEYLAITDHSQHLTVASGLKPKELMQQLKTIDKLNAKLKKLVILKSSEIDILEDGKLDWPESLLKELDLTICSIHYKFNLPIEKQTERVIRAMDNPYFNILGHATGRLINRREPYAIDIEKIMLAAKERGCILEINAQPDRLDLKDIFCKQAKEKGVKLALSTDAHSIHQLQNMRFGVYQARRAWLEKKDVINTLGLADLRKALRKK